MLYKKREFRGVTLDLDGHEFIECTFDKCTVIYRGGPLPKMRKNKFVQTNFTFADAADRTLQYLRELYAQGNKELVEGFMAQLRR
jgi:hypothetical protein